MEIVFGFGTLLIGYVIVTSTVRHVDDSKLKYIYVLWPIKFMIVTLISSLIWQPSSSTEGRGSWGTDPQRFLERIDLISAGLDGALTEFNHPGLILIFAELNRLPLDSAWLIVYVNLLLSLLTGCLVVVLAYKGLPNRRRGGWTIGLVLLIPDFMWHDAMLTKESFSSLLVLLFACGTGFVLTNVKAFGPALSYLMLTTSVLGMATVRPRLLLVCSVSVVIFVLVSQVRRRQIRKAAAGGLVAGLFALAFVTSESYWRHFVGQQVNTSLGEGLPTGAGAQGPALVQDIAQSIITQSGEPSTHDYLSRLAGYALAPLHKANIDFQLLLGGDWLTWSLAISSLSALVLVLLLLPTLRASYLAISCPSTRNFPLLASALVLTYFVSVTAGTDIIHERYRSAIMPMYLLLAWFGVFAPRKAKSVSRASSHPVITTRTSTHRGIAPPIS